MRQFQVLLIGLLTVVGFAGPAVAAEPQELWIYTPSNLLVAENVDKLETLWKRAAAAGYTHVFLSDSKFSRLNSMDPRYFKNVERCKKIAAGLKLKLVLAVFPVGYANDMLSNDPNLVEGFPAKNTPFIVKGGIARFDDREPVSFKKAGFVDEPVKVEGNLATVSEHTGVARMIYPLKVIPYRCYHISVSIKTANYNGHPEIKAIGGEWTLQWQNLGVKQDQDWTMHHVVFNSLDHSEVGVYFGDWSPSKGSLQWKDWKIEEVGLLNLIRRPGAPLTVTSEDEKKTFVEGKDFEPVVDPNMGQHPWAGEFESWHEAPVIKIKGGLIPDGTKLRVSWYHPEIIYDGQVGACINEPKHKEIMADQARQMKKVWGKYAAGWMMQFDEFRTLGWDKSCLDTKQTPGQNLARTVKECEGFLGEGPIYTWNDMFDPFHNAVKGPYYLVNGPWTDAWEGLSSKVIILNWNEGKRDESLKFFVDRGHKQIIATYYDDPSLKSTRNWVKSATRAKGVIGYMYTTWVSNYDALEKFAQVVRGEIK